MSRNIPKFMSDLFLQFARDWGIELKISLPNYPKSKWPRREVYPDG